MPAPAVEFNKVPLLRSESISGQRCVVVWKRWALTAHGAWLWRWADDACTEILLNWPAASRLPNEAQLGELRCWLNTVCEGLGPRATLGDTVHPNVDTLCVSPCLEAREREAAP
jgi:hypothetical protein